jgi:acetyl-CoA acetyltransferase family protein
MADVGIILGLRTPFVKSHDAFVEWAPWQLGQMLLAGLRAQIPVDPKLVELGIMGTVISDSHTPNVARESFLGGGWPREIPCHTVSMACISSNLAATALADQIALGRVHLGICGGLDTCSDPPIRLGPKVRKALVRLEKAKTIGAKWRELRKMGAPWLDVPKVAEFSSGKSMGEGAEILGRSVGITREEADQFAARSHRVAVEAQQSGWYDGDILPAFRSKTPSPITKDDGPRADATLEKLATLKPAFDKTFGLSTAGSSSFLTDGASCLLLASETACREHNLTPKAWLRDYLYGAGDPLFEMLSGPSLTVPRLLHKWNLTVSDIAVWEIHEAFGVQVLANLKNIASDTYVQTRLGLPQSPGTIPMDQINTKGGSLSLGHPFGATGTRLIWNAARRLEAEGGRWAVVASCAAGGHGSAILIERNS